MPSFKISASVIDSIQKGFSESGNNGNIPAARSINSIQTGSNCGLTNSSSNSNIAICLPVSMSRLSNHVPVLDAVLRKATNSTDLEKVDHIQMRVSSNIYGLSQLHVFLPNLTALNLDGSSLTNLRDLGCELKIKYLNVSRCNLKSFDGISGFDSIEHLIADENQISSILQLNALKELRMLSLMGNKIIQIDTVAFLSLCKSLIELNLTNNDVTKSPDYREHVNKVLPALLILDGFALSDLTSSDGKQSLSECSSSLTSSISKDFSSTSGNNGSSRSELCTTADKSKNSYSADLTSTQINSEPVVGNIINKVRHRRKPKICTLNMSPSSSSISSVELVRTIKSLKFQADLPQATAVPLESGLINIEQSSIDEIERSSEHLIDMCHQWSSASRISRKK